MRSAGGSRLAPDRVLKESLSFDAVRTSPARSARPSAPRSATSDGGGGGGPRVGTQMDAVRGGDAGRCRRRRAQVIEATRGRPGDAVEGGAVLREEREGRE